MAGIQGGWRQGVTPVGEGALTAAEIVEAALARWDEISTSGSCAIRSDTSHSLTGFNRSAPDPRPPARPPDP